MDHNDKPAFVEHLQALAAVFKFELDDPIVLGYWLALKHYDLTAVIRSIAKAVQICKFFPKPAELIEFLQPDVETEVFNAWSTAARVLGVDSFCGRPSVDFEDKVINAAIRSLGGIGRIVDMTKTDFLTWYRKEFENAYRIYLANPPDPIKCKPLIGDAKSIKRIPRTAPRQKYLTHDE